MFCGALDSLCSANASNQVQCSLNERKEITSEVQVLIPKKRKKLFQNHKRPRISEKDKFQPRVKAKKTMGSVFPGNNDVATSIGTSMIITTNNKNDSLTTGSRIVTDDNFSSLAHEDKVLKDRFQMSTAQERKRFLSGRTLDRASDKMQSFMIWRQQYRLEETHLLPFHQYNDLEVWNYAVSHAVSCYRRNENTSKRQRNTPPIDNSQMVLPRIVKFGDDPTDFRANDGRRIALVNPALIDNSIAPLELYASCIAVYLYLKLDRQSEENIHVLIDVRAGKGWPNPPPTVLIPFVKTLSKLLVDNMPERMYKCILFPLPIAAKPIWGVFKKFLDRKVVSKMHILFGPASSDSRIPKGMESESFDAERIAQLERSRQFEFKP